MVVIVRQTKHRSLIYTFAHGKETQMEANRLSFCQVPTRLLKDTRHPSVPPQCPLRRPHAQPPVLALLLEGVVLTYQSPTRRVAVNMASPSGSYPHRFDGCFSAVCAPCLSKLKAVVDLNGWAAKKKTQWVYMGVPLRFLLSKNIWWRVVLSVPCMGSTTAFPRGVCRCPARPPVLTLHLALIVDKRISASEWVSASFWIVHWPDSGVSRYMKVLVLENWFFQC